MPVKALTVVHDTFIGRYWQFCRSKAGARKEKGERGEIQRL